VLPVSNGNWAQARVSISWANEAITNWQPMSVDYGNGLQITVEGETGYANNWLFIQGRPLITGMATGDRDRPSDNATRAGDDLDDWLFQLRTGVGVVGFNHVLVAGTQPLRWGEGIFGGLTMDTGWQRFFHATLASATAWPIFELGGERAFLRYEAIYGAANNDDDDWLAGPQIAGGRISLRREWLTLGYHGVRRMSEGGDLALNEATVALEPWSTVWLRGGVAWQGTDPDLQNTGYQITLDFADLTGQQTWRWATEYIWTGDNLYGGEPGNIRYRFGSTSLGHSDGASASTVRSLLQYRYEEAGSGHMLLAWRKRGVGPQEHQEELLTALDLGFTGTAGGEIGLGAGAWWPLHGPEDDIIPAVNLTWSSNF
jgi:hypothetical protein